jgi:hypothetical protein
MVQLKYRYCFLLVLFKYWVTLSLNTDCAKYFIRTVLLLLVTP